MAVELNHTIVRSTAPDEAAKFIADVLGLDPPTRFGPFTVVKCANGVSLDVMGVGEEPIESQHYAFLVSEEEFDQIFGRIRDGGLPHWADPGKGQPNAINHGWGGRGVYFEGPDGHLLEILTVPYGGW